MATNELGHLLARDLGNAETTLGAYRGGNRISWLPGATIDAWVPCARGEVATGVPWPHVYFVQTIGSRTAESGSIYCLSCRQEVAARRASGATVPAPAPVAIPSPTKAPSVSPTLALPF